MAVYAFCLAQRRRSSRFLPLYRKAQNDTPYVMNVMTTLIFAVNRSSSMNQSHLLLVRRIALIVCTRRHSYYRHAYSCQYFLQTPCVFNHVWVMQQTAFVGRVVDPNDCFFVWVPITKAAVTPRFPNLLTENIFIAVRSEFKCPLLWHSEIVK